jgi:hypothetical protein
MGVYSDKPVAMPTFATSVLTLFTPDVKANLALGISLLSPLLSFLFGVRDRAVLRATCRYIEAWNDGEAYINVHIVNQGRRPIILRMWSGVESGGKNWVGTYLGDHKAGLRLGEHEIYEFNLRRDDLYAMTPDEDVVFADLWVEDTIGRRHKVGNAKASIAKLNRT